MKAIKKEIFEIKSIEGINVAGKTSRLENISVSYTHLRAHETG